MKHLILPVLALVAINSGGFAQDKTTKVEKGPARFEDSIAKIEARDKATPPADGTVLFVGSSSIRMWDLEKSWPQLKVLNNGFGGSTLNDSIYFFDRIIAPYKNLSTIVIYAGDNDVASGLTAEEVLADFVKLREKISKAHPTVPIIFVAIKPSTKRWAIWPAQEAANKKIAALAEKDDMLYYADIATPTLGPDGSKPDAKRFKEDGLHLNDDGYAEWVEVIKPLLEKAGAYSK